jgi:hypothetical protein
MKRIAVAAVVAMLGTNAHAADGDENWFGYLDLNSFVEYENNYADNYHLNNNMSGTIQYRVDSCAVGVRLGLGKTAYNADSKSIGFDVTRYGLDAQTGCKFGNLWIAGFGGVSRGDWENSGLSESTEQRVGIGLYYQFRDDLGLGLSAAQEYEHYTRDYTAHYDFRTFELKLDYFLHENLLLSSKLTYQDEFQWSWGSVSSIFAQIEYKPNNWNMSAYAGIGTILTRYQTGDEAQTDDNYTATVGLRWYFNSGSLQSLHNNSMPTF